MLIIRSADQTETGSAGAQPVRDNRLKFVTYIEQAFVLFPLNQHKTIYRAFGLPHNPGGTMKTIISDTG